MTSLIYQDPLQKNHELILWGERIDWEEITDGLMPFFIRRGRRGKKIRLMVGLHILQHRFNVSDEAVVKGLQENVYKMAFCGVKLAPRYVRIDGGFEVLPCEFVEVSTLTKFRGRVGAEGMKIVEKRIKEILISEKQMCPRSQFADTTAQPKDIAYPLDTDLLNRGRHRLVRTVRRLRGQGVQLVRGVRISPGWAEGHG